MVQNQLCKDTEGVRIVLDVKGVISRAFVSVSCILKRFEM